VSGQGEVELIKAKRRQRSQWREIRTAALPSPTGLGVMVERHVAALARRRDFALLFVPQFRDERFDGNDPNGLSRDERRDTVHVEPTFSRASSPKIRFHMLLTVNGVGELLPAGGRRGAGKHKPGITLIDLRRARRPTPNR